MRVKWETSIEPEEEGSIWRPSLGLKEPVEERSPSLFVNCNVTWELRDMWIFWLARETKHSIRVLFMGSCSWSEMEEEEEEEDGEHENATVRCHLEQVLRERERRWFLSVQWIKRWREKFFTSHVRREGHRKFLWAVLCSKWWETSKKLVS